MNHYRCILGGTSTMGMHFYEGQIINEMQYSVLNNSEKTNFELMQTASFKIKDNSPDRSPDIPYPSPWSEMPVQVFETSSYSIPDQAPDTNFGGGDFGGGGASGEW